MTKIRRIIIITAISIAAILLPALSYIAYLFGASHRIKDNLEIIPENLRTKKEIALETACRISSMNVGFGAYSQNFTFFMDGGKSSRAQSRDEVLKNINGCSDTVLSYAPDIMLFQEVDVNGTRSHHVNEKELISGNIRSRSAVEYDSAFAVNFDSPYLFWPPYEPHGKNKSGILTLSEYKIQSSVRRSLPVEEGTTRILDLDRCYTKSLIKTENGRFLAVYNVHLSAYTKNESVAKNQIIMLNKDMFEEYSRGSYVIAGGDFNKEVVENACTYYGFSPSRNNWAKPFPKELLNPAFTLIGPFDESKPVPSCRDCDIPYSSENFVTNVDGFIVSDNIKVIGAETVDASFRNTDHNPVYMDFILKK